MTWRCIRSFPVFPRMVKCVAPGDLGTTTSVVDESATILMCVGLPIMMLPAGSSRRMSSDLSGVTFSVGCVSPLSGIALFSDVVTVGGMSITVSCAFSVVAEKNTAEQTSTL